jgi:hypothetical protein
MRHAVIGCSVVLGLAAAFVLARSVLANEVQGGGNKAVKSDAPNYESQKISTGGQSSNVYHFTFKADFDVKDVHVTIQHGDGSDFESNDGSASVTAVSAHTGSGGTTHNGTASGHSGSVNNDASAGHEFSVDVTADTSSLVPSVTFLFSFSTKVETPGGQDPKHKMILPPVRGGHRSFYSAAVLETNEGVHFRVVNDTEPDLMGGRFQLVGCPGILIESVSADGLVVDVAPDNRSFVLTGPIASLAECEVDVTFNGAVVERGALLGFYDAD